MKILNLTSTSPEQTIKIAQTIAKNLSNQGTIVLTGELGSGKTKFTEGFLTYYNLQDEISSPTFNIVNEYHSNDINIYHFDVYRLSDIDEFYAIGGDEYFYNGICLVEWGEMIQDALPEEYLQIIFKKDESNSDLRNLELKAKGLKYEQLLTHLFKITKF